MRRDCSDPITIPFGFGNVSWEWGQLWQKWRGQWAGALACLVCSVATLSPLAAEEPEIILAQNQVSNQMRGSLNRLQSLDSSAQQRAMQERDQDIQELLPHFRVTGEGSSDRQIREQALKKLNATQLTPSGRQTAQQVVDRLSLFRRLPEVRFEVHPETYDYFLGNPDVVVSMWQALGISAVNLKQVKPYHYAMNNTDGTTSDVFYIRRSKEANIVYCDGEFKSPLLKNPISAKGILCLYAQFEVDPDGTTYVRHQADVFVTFPNAAVGTAARLISPVSYYVADRNFQEISLFLHTMSLTMTHQPGWIQQQATKMRGLTPEQMEGLMQITLDNYQANQKRMATHWQEEAPLRR